MSRQSAIPRGETRGRTRGKNGQNRSLPIFLRPPIMISSEHAKNDPERRPGTAAGTDARLLPTTGSKNDAFRRERS
jgi:hypothetical protein